MHIVNLYKIPWNKKYTYEEIQKATGLSKMSIAHLFSGEYYDFKLSTLEKIAEFFKCEISDILIKVENDKTSNQIS